MKALFTEVWIKLKTRWFFLCAGLTVLVLFMTNDRMSDNLTLLSLPLIAALPASASLRREAASGSLRTSLFRLGYGACLFCKTGALLLVTALSFLLGLGLWALLYRLTVSPFLPVSLAQTAGRLLFCLVFSLVGSFGALLIRDSISAYVLPVTLTFALSMIRSRFLVDARFMDPSWWISGEKEALFFLAGMLIIMTGAYSVYVSRLLKNNV